MTHVARGQFVWHELLTDDPAAAETFYRALLGWKFQAWDDGPVPYTMFGPTDVMIGGLSAPPGAGQADGGGASWFCYVHTPDVDAAVTTAESHGGALVGGPFDVPQVGRMATLRDPVGALISAFAFADPERYRGLTHGPGSFCWYELQTAEPDRIVPFYAALFDWRAEAVALDGRDYRVMHCGDNPVAGIVAAAGDGASQWRVSIEVEDVDAAARSATVLGGTLVAGPEELAVGRYATIRDPQGAVFGLFRGHAAAEARP